MHQQESFSIMDLWYCLRQHLWFKFWMGSTWNIFHASTFWIYRNKELLVLSILPHNKQYIHMQIIQCIAIYVLFVIGRGLYPTSLASIGTTIPILLKHLPTIFLFLALQFFDSPIEYPSSLDLAINFLLKSLSFAFTDPVFNLFATCKLILQSCLSRLKQ